MVLTGHPTASPEPRQGIAPSFFAVNTTGAKEKEEMGSGLKRTIKTLMSDDIVKQLSNRFGIDKLRAKI